jgi:pantoate kinase
VFGKAFSPSGVSSFFQVCTHDESGAPITDNARIGARGGGFALSKGVTSKVFAEKTDEPSVETFINGRKTLEAITTETMLGLITEKLEQKYEVRVEHSIDVPIGAGFGTSAAGALSSGLALAHALALPLTYNQIARLAHVADVLCNTGLGTVEGLTVGGLVLVVKSGAIGIGLVDRIPIRPDLRVVAGVYKTMDKSSVIMSKEKVEVINRIAEKTMNRILAEPTLANFLGNCKSFALNSGLASERVENLIYEAEAAGAIGATQNMIGEAVHAVTTKQNLNEVLESFEENLPRDKITVSDIEFRGARIV